MKPPTFGWDRVEASAWEVIAKCLPLPWPEEAMIQDVRFWKGQERVTKGRVQLPGRPTLAKRWGCTDWQVKAILKGEAWIDPFWEAEEPTDPAPENRQPTASPPPASRQDTASRPPATDRTNAGDSAETASQPPGHRQPSASPPPAERHARSLLTDPPIHRSTDHTHTPPPAGVCVSDPESEGNPEPEPKGPTPLDLVRDWHAFIGRQCPENPSGLDLAGETIAKHGERAWDAVVQATHKLKASKMLPTTMYFGGLRAPLAQVVLPAAAPKQTPAPEPPPEAVEAFDEPDRQRAEDAWREALEARIGAQNMEIWMHHVRVALVSLQLVRLEMESRYYLDWIEDNLGRELAAVWAEVLGAKPALVMEVAPVRPALRVARREEPDRAPAVRSRESLAAL